MKLLSNSLTAAAAAYVMLTDRLVIQTEVSSGVDIVKQLNTTI